MIWIHLAVILWLAVCAAQDLLRRQVSNWLTIPPFAAAGVWAVWRGGETLLLYGLVTLVMLVLFWKGGTGGADGKILAVLAVVSPAALILALAANTLIGVVVYLRYGRGVRYPAVPGFAAGALLSIPIQFFSGGL
jgi:Flp pilus assembly protein protease CpaA